MANDVDLVFKALADSTRRRLLDKLREHDGLTLAELCDGIDMTRQSATQHLAVLEAANLISTERRGREKLHHLNAVPLHEMQERWIDRFERPRLRALSTLKRRAEEAAMTERHTFKYVTYIEASADQVWHALTDPEVTAQYWGHANVSDWDVGSSWAHVRLDGSGIVDCAGTVVESVRPTRLVTTWGSPEEGDSADDTSRVTYELEQHDGIVRLTVTHEDLTTEGASQVSHGWPAVLANLKSLLETGHPLPQDPWTMAPADHAARSR